MGSIEVMVVPMPLIYLLTFSGPSEIAWSFKVLFNSVSTEEVFGVQMTFGSFYYRVEAICKR